MSLSRPCIALIVYICMSWSSRTLIIEIHCPPFFVSSHKKLSRGGNTMSAMETFQAGSSRESESLRGSLGSSRAYMNVGGSGGCPELRCGDECRHMVLKIFTMTSFELKDFQKPGNIFGVEMCRFRLRWKREVKMLEMYPYTAEEFGLSPCEAFR